MRIGRVRTRSSFAVLRRHGARARCGTVAVTFVPAGPGELGVPCVAFAIGRATGPAVVRNRLRRRLRAAVAELGPAPGTYLLRPDAAAATQPAAGLRADLAEALTAVGALVAR